MLSGLSHINIEAHIYRYMEKESLVHISDYIERKFAHTYRDYLDIETTWRKWHIDVESIWNEGTLKEREAMAQVHMHKVEIYLPR